MTILIEAELRRYLIGGVNPPKAASLTGDLSQMEKALVARILQSTSPGLSAVAGGSIGEQIQYLVNNSPGATGWMSALDALGKVFPFTNGSVTDLTINGSDQTVAPTNGVLRYRTITFTTAHTLRITASPCILMVDTLVWNAAGVLACEASGAPALGADPAENFPRGGRSINTGDAIGGYGGGFLIVLAGTVNGSTLGTIRANGTAGNSNATAAGALATRGGEGALSARMFYANYAPSTGSFASESWGGSPSGANNYDTAPSLPAAFVLANGGDSAASNLDHGSGGGGAYGANAAARGGGGSGFGGGGGVNSAGSVTAVPSPVITASVDQILELHKQGCRGGGGGASCVHTTGANNAAGGGGGGCVVLIVDTETQVSTLTAAGGAKSGNASNAVNGGAGVTLREVV